MADIEITPSQVHASAGRMEEHSAQMARAATQVESTQFDTGDGFRTTAALNALAQAWGRQTRADASHIDTLSTAVHESAAVMSAAESDATVASDALRARIETL